MKSRSVLQYATPDPQQNTWSRASGFRFGFRVSIISGSVFRVSGAGSDFESRHPGPAAEYLLPCFGCQVWVSSFGNSWSRFSGFGVGFGFRVTPQRTRSKTSASVFPVSGSGFGFGFRVSGFGFRVSGIGFGTRFRERISGFGFRVEG